MHAMDQNSSMKQESNPICVLSIAGSDPSGGAGIQADLKAIAAHGHYGMSVVTALTAQNTTRVRWVQAVGPGGIRAQLRSVLEDLPVHAVKIGMLPSPEAVDAVLMELMGVDLPIVLDPVLGASAGGALNEAPEALRKLVPLCALVTPNLPELERLPWLEEQGVPLLIKGGHGSGERLHDRLVGPGLERRWTWPRLDTRNLHGTGCTLSSAIACRLGEGLELEEDRSLRWLQRLIRASADHRLGEGTGPLLHHLG